MENGGQTNPVGEVMVDGDDARATLVGEIDVACAAMLQQRLDEILETTSGAVVLDMSGVSFIDSEGLRVLLELHRRLSASRRSLILRHVSAPARRLFDLAGVDKTLHIDGST